MVSIYCFTENHTAETAEQTKGEIVGSALSQALGMSATGPGRSWLLSLYLRNGTDRNYLMA